MLVRSFVSVAILAAVAAVVLFMLHSFAYLLAATFAVVYALAAVAAKLLRATRAGRAAR
jgi:hypothetical protein